MEGSMSSDRDALRRARAYLMRVAEPPTVALAAFVARHGAEQAAQLVSLGQVPAAVADETSARRHLACGKEQLARAAECGARLLIPEDEEWPRWPFLALRNAAGRG